ncbi:hypothetical protein VTJ49DRAFT_3543 [Mycothermus thermophilus]|uniref:Gem-associated protein 5 TPR domain-containing protein n=1 Tax=Humicola insolens TaxID=85995 RepID=A0ABR3V776_HUMIN
MSATGLHGSRSRAGSSTATHDKGRLAHMQHGYAMSVTGGPTTPSGLPRYFEPCAATASMFLYAQGTSVVCCHYDTLAIERRFARHSEEVQILAVDNHSDIGAGRLVVSYDAGQTAIVWDLMTGDEVARFASYENLTCAAWMRNGNVAFGNSQGTIILFEPTTSEHLATRTLDQIAITAISPGTDCRTFAIGYQNGSLLIATLQPRFTILHNLTTSRGPSSIVTLAWHASSARSKSDMLAVQTLDGDLRVWSVSKTHNTEDPAKIVRILKRTENYLVGPNWMGWSKNGRIIQFSEGETISWDVRTKHVTYDTIPTLETVRGLAVYGPGATLFTLGANNTVQQFDLNAPAMMVNNVQHPANLLPPSPPISLEAEDKSNVGNVSESESNVEITFRPSELSSEAEDDGRSPLARYLQASESGTDYRPTTPASNISRSTVSISSSTSQTAQRRYPPSTVSRGLTEHTYISAGSSLRSGQPVLRKERESLSTTSSVSMGSSQPYQHRATPHQQHRPSRLRNEVPRSPDDGRVSDLFKFTRSRLADVPYKAPYSTDHSRMTNDDLRRQMLRAIFGWHKDIDDLVRDEMERHPLGSANRILLARWLGDITTDIMAMGSENMTSSDWMLLALSGIGGQASQHKLGRAYVQRLLESGDVHTAATIMVGMGDYNDAIEIYVSHKKYMEALLLTCLFFPATWERQEQIVKKWGEWAVQHGQQQLAIRCFACTGQTSSEPWSSPSAQQLHFPSMNQTVPELLSPPLSPPVANLGPQRSIAKSSALKLITTFDGPAKAKLLGGEDGKTPVAAAATPILESALSPGADPTTAILRGNRSAFNTPASARPAHGFGRPRLPSIGESPDSAQRERMAAEERARRGEDASASDVSQDSAAIRALEKARPNTASPRLVKTSSSKAQPPPPPGPTAMAALMGDGRPRGNSSRTRIPEGLDLSLPAFNDSLRDDITSPEPSAGSSNVMRYHWPSRRRGPSSVAGSVTSSVASTTSAGSSLAGRSHRHHAARGLDDYIHSLDAAQSSRRAQQVRGSSRDGRRETSQTRRGGDRDKSRDRGRGIASSSVASSSVVSLTASARSYTPKGGKRSPKSPVPMSPEDLINLATEDGGIGQTTVRGRRHVGDDSDGEMEPASQPSTVRKVGYADRGRERGGSRSRNASRAGRGSSRARSPGEGGIGDVGVRSASRNMRRPAPPALDLRGRSSSRGPTPARRSPSSPQPMSSAGLRQHLYASDDEEDYRLAVEEQEQFRRRNNRSTSRASRGSRGGGGGGGGEGLTSPTSTRSGWSARERSEVRRTTSHAGTGSRKMGVLPLATPAPLQLVTDSSGDLKVIKDERQLKKEAAARELEERRKSLARRPSAPPIVHPDELRPSQPQQPSSAGLAPLPSTTYVPPRKEDLPLRSASVDHTAGRSMYANRGNAPAFGLPATPRAMRLVLEAEARRGQGSSGGSSGSNVPVPPIPTSFTQQQPQHSPGRMSPKKEPEEPRSAAPKDDGIPLLLPSTVYTPPPPHNSRLAAQIGRSMSAPPQDLVQPQQSHGHSRRPSLLSGQGGRRPSHDAGAGPARRPSQDNNASSSNIPPPPPPPVPPMLKELAHLAQPPPPPPAPLPHMGGPKPVVYGGSSSISGMIEIVMDDESQEQPQQQRQSPPPPQQQQQQQFQGGIIQGSEAIVPTLSPPPHPRNATNTPSQAAAAASHQKEHTRGRSSVDNSIGARISRATERMRSASRNRGTRSAAATSAAAAPPAGDNNYEIYNGPAPYESIPPLQVLQAQAREQLQLAQQYQYHQQQHQQSGSHGSHPPVSMANNGVGYRLQNQVVLQQVQAQVAQQEGRNEFRTGLRRGEMI